MAIKTEDIKRFISVAEYARQYNPTTKKFNGVTYLQALDMGVSAETLKYLKSHHYISINKNRDIWIAWKNPKYPEFNMDKLNELLSLHEINGDEFWQV